MHGLQGTMIGLDVNKWKKAENPLTFQDKSGMMGL
jgi:hypothetical protein